MYTLIVRHEVSFPDAFRRRRTAKGNYLSASSCPSVRMEQPAFHWTDFSGILFWGIWLKCVDRLNSVYVKIQQTLTLRENALQFVTSPRAKRKVVRKIQGLLLLLLLLLLNKVLYFNVLLLSKLLYFHVLLLLLLSKVLYFHIIITIIIKQIIIFSCFTTTTTTTTKQSIIFPCFIFGGTRGGAVRCRSQWPSGVRRGSSAADWLQGLWVRIPRGHGCLRCVVQ